MKKKITYLVLSMCIILLAGGCKSKNNDTDTDVTPTPVVAEGTEDTQGTEVTEGTEEVTEGTEGTESEAIEPIENELERGEYNVNDFVTLGNYKGVEVTVEANEVTEDSILIAVQSDLQANGATLTEVTGRAVKLGDTVNIDYEGLKGGVAFEGGTAAAQDLMIGSGSFIPGFEEQLIGTKAGDKVDIDVTFPEEYGSADLAGQAVVFKVTVNKIQEYSLTDEFVTTNTDFDSIDANKTSIVDSLNAANETSRKAEIENSVYNSIVDGSKISSLPQTLLDYYKNDIKVYYTNYAAAYSMDFAGFLSASGVTEAQFEVDSLEYAENMATRDLVFGAIIKAEGIEISEDEYNEQVAIYAADYGYESADALIAASDPELLREDILYKKVQEFLVAEAVVK